MERPGKMFIVEPTICGQNLTKIQFLSSDKHVAHFTRPRKRRASLEQGRNYGGGGSNLPL